MKILQKTKYNIEEYFIGKCKWCKIKVELEEYEINRLNYLSTQNLCPHCRKSIMFHKKTRRIKK